MTFFFPNRKHESLLIFTSKLPIAVLTKEVEFFLKKAANDLHQSIKYFTGFKDCVVKLRIRKLISTSRLFEVTVPLREAARL